MLYLSEALKINHSIQQLNLGKNNPGQNEKNLLYLKEALIINNSIQQINLEKNNLGQNEKKKLIIYQKYTWRILPL